MTDTDLNRLVAEVRGWTSHIKTHTDPPDVPIVYWVDGEGKIVDSRLLSVASSPAAWGALHDELKASGYDIELLIRPGLPANVRMRKPGALQSGCGTDAEIGRAVARAFLGA
jgi:hypothetical protein